MYTTDNRSRSFGLALTTAMAGVLLAGCATSVAPQAAVSASEAQQAMAKGRHASAVDHAEAAVLAEPRSAQYRAVLGQAYLDAGRFASAQASFDDAMELGDNSPRTALSLALALTAQAKYSEASALLSDWEQHIAVSDLGLALALAGRPDRGIHLMSNAIRGGDNTVKMRQNLAYAYALAGRWRDARIMVSQDVPADQVGDRMARWGELVHPGAYQYRVAGLLGVPAGVSDSGQPVQLALANHPSVDQLAAHAAADMPVPQVAQAPAPIERVAVPASRAELPALVDNRYTQVAPALAPVVAPIAVAPVQAPVRAVPVEPAVAPEWVRNPERTVAPDAVRLVDQPVTQSAPIRHAAPVTPRVSGRAPASEGTRPVATRAVAPREAIQAAVTTPSDTAQRPARATAQLSATPSGGTHLVQLGSFSSEQAARRAWGIYVARYPQLATRDLVITEAMVRGKRYFRVSAGGFNRAESRSMCSSPSANGGDGCIAWAEGSPLPGAVDNGVRLARR